MKIVLLTNKNSLYGKMVANDLISRGIKIYSIVVISQPLGYYLKLFRFVRKRTSLADAIYFSFRYLASSLGVRTPSLWKGSRFIDDYNSLSSNIFNVRQTNSQEMVKILKDISPDVMILGQTGIVGGSILSISNIGTLNAHPAILPFYRGNDGYLWAAYNNEFEKIGSSVHWVNEGVDTGDIIYTSVYNFTKREKLRELENNLNNNAISLLSDAVYALCKKKQLPRQRQQKYSGTQYFKMPRRTENIAKQRLINFFKDKGW